MTSSLRLSPSTAALQTPPTTERDSDQKIARWRGTISMEFPLTAHFRSAEGCFPAAPQESMSVKLAKDLD